MISRDWNLSARRIFAWVAVTGFHLVLLMALLRPVAPLTDGPPVMDVDRQALRLRFISSPRSIPSPPTPALSPVAPAPIVPRTASKKHAMAPPERRVGHVAARLPDQYANSRFSAEDGGFRERLLDAQHSRDVHGLPGSETPVAPGIRLDDPGSQGIGAVMRNVQRLFGVTSRHCIDVEVWQHLSPDALAARHLSATDLKRQAEKYGCNRPPGLHF